MASTVGTKAAVFRAIAQARRSTKRFKRGETISDEVLTDILQTAMRAPSSFNLQPTQIILVRNPDVKENIANNAMLGIGNKYKVQDCSALAVFLADLEAGKRIERIYKLEKEWGKRHPNYMALMPLNTSFLLGEGHASTLLKQLATDLLSEMQPMPVVDPVQAWAYKNSALVALSYVLAATSHDLATTMMEGFDARRLKEILRVPDRYDVPVMVATGYEYEHVTKEDYTPRLKFDEVVFQDQFGTPISCPTNDHDDAEAV